MQLYSDLAKSKLVRPSFKGFLITVSDRDYCFIEHKVFGNRQWPQSSTKNTAIHTGSAQQPSLERLALGIEDDLDLNANIDLPALARHKSQCNGNSPVQ
jgi:hypothetical protein